MTSIQHRTYNRPAYRSSRPDGTPNDGWSTVKKTLLAKREVVDRKANDAREERDRNNGETQTHLKTRREASSKVRELIDEMQKQREIRDGENARVRELKDARRTRTTELREVRDNLKDLIEESGGSEGKRSNPARLRKEIQRLEWSLETGSIGPNKERETMDRLKRLFRELKEAEKADSGNTAIGAAKKAVGEASEAHEEAHQAVGAAAEAAQSAHDLMGEISREVDRLRDEAQRAHRKVERFRRVADQHHQRYVVSLRCLHSIQDLVRASENRGKGLQGVDERVEVKDLMDLLMSGETVGIDDLMALRRTEG